MKTGEIDNRIVGIVKPVTEGIGKIVCQELFKAGLITEEGEPITPMTAWGGGVLGHNINEGVRLALANATIESPVGFSLDEIELTKGIVGSCADMELVVDGNAMKLKFNHPGAPISQIISPLDPAQQLEGLPIQDTNALVDIHRLNIAGRGLADMPSSNSDTPLL